MCSKNDSLHRAQKTKIIFNYTQKKSIAIWNSEEIS